MISTEHIVMETDPAPHSKTISSLNVESNLNENMSEPANLTHHKLKSAEQYDNHMNSEIGVTEQQASRLAEAKAEFKVSNNGSANGTTAYPLGEPWKSSSNMEEEIINNPVHVKLMEKYLKTNEFGTLGSGSSGDVKGDVESLNNFAGTNPWRNMQQTNTEEVGKYNKQSMLSRASESILKASMEAENETTRKAIYNQAFYKHSLTGVIAKPGNVDGLDRQREDSESGGAEMLDSDDDNQAVYEEEKDITAALNINNNDLHVKVDVVEDSKGQSHANMYITPNKGESVSYAQLQRILGSGNENIKNTVIADEIPDEYPSSKEQEQGSSVKKRSRKQSTTAIKRKKQKQKASDVVVKQEPVPTEDFKIPPDMQSTYMHTPVRFDDDPDKPHKCQVCNRAFKRASHVKRHMLIHTGDRNFGCEICGKHFSTGHYLKLHARLHTGEKPYQCETCKKTFTHYSNYKMHLRSHTNERPYPCHICGRSYTGSSHLKRHLLIHAQVKPYKCELCPKDFLQASQLRSHMLTHSGLKPFSCSICNKSFAQTYPLGKHMLMHGMEAVKQEIVGDPVVLAEIEKADKDKEKEATGTDPVSSQPKPSPYSRQFICKVCGQTFTSLKQHMRLHMDNNKLFFCTFCEKQFVELNNLKQHMLIHTGEKPFSCSECGKQFIQHSNLKAHMRIHTGERPYKCHVCGKAFAHSSVLKNHILFHTKEVRHHCKHCGKGFTDTSSLKKHVRTHTGEKPYTCTFCGRSFAASSSLKTHMFTHGGSRPYKCDHCTKQFARPSQLQKHLLKRHNVDRMIESFYSNTNQGFDHSRDAIVAPILEQNINEGTEDIDGTASDDPDVSEDYTEAEINDAMKGLNPLIAHAIEEVDRKIMLEQTAQLSDSDTISGNDNDSMSEHIADESEEIHIGQRLEQTAMPLEEGYTDMS